MRVCVCVCVCACVCVCEIERERVFVFSVQTLYFELWNFCCEIVPALIRACELVCVFMSACISIFDYCKRGGREKGRWQELNWVV